MLSECKDSANEEQIKKLKMKNASSFNFLFKCEFGLNLFYAFACIFAMENSFWHTPSIMLALSFAFIDVPLRLYWFYPLNLQTFSFVSTELFL